MSTAMSTTMSALEYTTHNGDTEINVEGTCGNGKVTASYKELVACFGEPMEGDGHKTDAEWHVQFGDGTIAAIYNWKNGRAYLGDGGPPLSRINEWMVGGMRGGKATEHVQVTIDLHREMAEKPKTEAQNLSAAREELLASITKHKGPAFAEAVHVATLIQKQVELFAIAMQHAESGEKIPDYAAPVLHHATIALSAQLMDCFVEAVGIVKTKQEATELVAWADRLSECEVNSVQAMLKRREQKRKED